MRGTSLLRDADGRPISEAPPWGCFAALVLGGFALFAVLAVVLRKPRWDAEVLAGVFLAPVMIGFGALGFFRLLHWLFPPGEEVGRREPNPAPGRGVVLERFRPTFSGVLLIWGMMLFWNVPVGVAAYGAVALVREGRTYAPLLIFVGVFALLGLVLLVLAVYAVLEEWTRLRGVREPSARLSAHPLRPGGSYELTLRQPGPVRLLELKVVLVGELTVATPDGEGGTHDKIETVCRDEILRKENVQVLDERPYAASGTFTVPPQGMPSRGEGPNKMSWKVVVQGRREGWPLGFAFDYPVTVVAAEADS
jgi:hypothetical protein